MSINISMMLTNQKSGNWPVDKGIWLVGFARDNLEYIALEQRHLEPSLALRAFLMNADAPEMLYVFASRNFMSAKVSNFR